ncbi:DUF6069 family protein [Ruania zhangjianzhongii]|uniref:DUF6069 family protein n=1 Tax=Ruania zhangjianzhongii TaxID=2603206 RepID=UPI0011C801A8|nr:DUF6069 family protein [Ruania zhangjianzhongii]
MTAEPATGRGRTQQRPALPRTVLPRTVLRRAAFGLLAATAINLALYATGRLVGAALSLDPAIGPPNHHLTAFDVAWKTFVPLSLGVGVLLLARLRSRAWVSAVMVLGAAVAVSTGAVPPLYAHDGITAVLLAGMHTVPGVALVWIGLAVRRASRRR